jgi:16S rRNA (adenine1518-N6/adenine1519-N6)-dimethyltransferase
MIVKAKKSLGQHFLKDESIALKIASSLEHCTDTLLEIGPGMGSLTNYLLQDWGKNLWVSEVDNDSVEYLKVHFPELKSNIIQGDFLQLDLKRTFNNDNISLIGNFPYNISTQILFKALDDRAIVMQIVGMFQKEVAKRICSPPGNRDYGILSVLIQAYYHTEYLFDVPPESFTPVPKVNSGVIRLKRKEGFTLGCDEDLFKKVVKTAFNQRRKKLSNALSILTEKGKISGKTGDLRAEQLSWGNFVELTNEIFKNSSSVK